MVLENSTAELQTHARRSSSVCPPSFRLSIRAHSMNGLLSRQSLFCLIPFPIKDSVGLYVVRPFSSDPIYNPLGRSRLRRKMTRQDIRKPGLMTAKHNRTLQRLELSHANQTATGRTFYGFQPGRASILLSMEHCADCLEPSATRARARQKTMVF